MFSYNLLIPLVLFYCLSIVLCFNNEKINPSQEPNRKARILLGTTTTVTTTLSTHTFCFTTSGNVVACTGKKKRSIKLNEYSNDQVNLEIQPTSTLKKKPMDQEKIIENKNNVDVTRNPRFLNSLIYVFTSTTTLTSTTFTATTTVTYVSCTPTSSILSACAVAG